MQHQLPKARDLTRISGLEVAHKKSLVASTSQITRLASPGPATNIYPKPESKQSEIMESVPKDEGEDKPVSPIPVKKAQKSEAIMFDGRISIISQIEGPREILSCKYSEGYDYIAAGFTDGVIRVYNTTNGEQAFVLADADVKDNRAPVTSVHHRPVTKIYPVTNCFTGTYANGCVKCWSYHFNQCLYTIKEKRQTFGLTYHPRFPKFVTYGDDMKVYFYDEETKTQERVLMASEDPARHDGHVSRIFAACFHPRNNYEFITGGWDDVIQFWDLRQPYAIRHISGVHMCAEGIDINPKGTEILSCSYQSNEQLCLWDYGSGKRISVLEPDIFNSKLYCGKYVSKDFIAMGGTDPNIFRVVDLQTASTSASINFLPGAVYCFDTGAPKKKHETTKEPSYRMKSDIEVVPKIAIVSTKKVYQIDFV